MQLLLESGILDRLKKRWVGRGSHICADLAPVRPLTLADLLAVLVITPLAAVFSCLLLGAELAGERLRRRHALLTVVAGRAVQTCGLIREKGSEI